MDSHAATELELYIDNDADLYRQMTTPIHRNLATKKARGEYKHDLAVKGFMHLMEAGAKKYAKDFGGTWHQMFDVPTRRAVAERFAKSFEAEYDLGNYDNLLPKKYQKKEQPKSTAVSGARKKQAKWNTPEGIAIAWSPVRQMWFALWPGRGRIEDQQVVKVAGGDDMDAWLKDTYGQQYGRGGGRSHGARKKSGSRGGQLQRDIDEVLAGRRH